MTHEKSEQRLKLNASSSSKTGELHNKEQVCEMRSYSRSNSKVHTKIDYRVDSRHCAPAAQLHQNCKCREFSRDLLRFTHKLPIDCGGSEMKDMHLKFSISANKLVRSSSVSSGGEARNVFNRKGEYEDRPKLIKGARSSAEISRESAIHSPEQLPKKCRLNQTLDNNNWGEKLDSYFQELRQPDSAQTSEILEQSRGKVKKSIECDRKISSEEETVQNTIRRDTATFFKQNLFGPDLSWQTNLITDRELDLNNNEDTSGDYDDASQEEYAIESDDLERVKLEQLVVQASVDKSGRYVSSTSSADRYSTTNKIIISNEVGDDFAASPPSPQRQHKEGDEESYRRSIFKFPSYSNQSSATHGKSSSTFSDPFDDTSGISRVKLTRVKDHSTPRLHLTIANLRIMMQRNLVATLVGVYILVSLTIIVVLILPYIFNLPLAITSEDNSPASYKRVSVSNPVKQENQLDKGTQTSIELLNSSQAAGLASSGEKGLDMVESQGASIEPKATPKKSKQCRDKRGAIVSNDRQVNSTCQVESTDKIHNHFHDLWKVAHNSRCQPLKVPFCSRSFETMFTGYSSVGVQQEKSIFKSINMPTHLSYERTLLPNQFTLTHQSQIERILQKYEPVIDIKCYALMPLFLCSIYAPKCIPINQTQSDLFSISKSAKLTQTDYLNIDSQITEADQYSEARSKLTTMKKQRPSVKTSAFSTDWSRLVPPCRSLCKEAFRKCTFFFEVLSLTLLNPEDCELLPESPDPDVCLGQWENSLLQRALDMQKGCQDDKFQCSDGNCIPKNWRCDGFPDCMDKSDELKCSKCNVMTQFYCGQDTCINKDQVCNGIRDCIDGRDERQCMRLSQTGSSTTPLVHRRLEVWSAVKDDWLPVCGSHWSAMPLSHEACQALGYSRANATLILFKPMPKHDFSKFGNLSQPIQVRGTSALENSPRGINYRSFDVGGWFDAVSKIGDPEAITEHKTERLASIVEDNSSVDSSANGMDFQQTERADHLVTYGRQSGFSSFANRLLSNKPADLKAIDKDEVKLKSLNSMLYHGPQAGCVNKPDYLVSTVHLQCSDFQCGRSITSYSSRMRIMQQQSTSIMPTSGSNGNRVNVSPAFRSTPLQIQSLKADIERSSQQLDAAEEFEPIDSSGNSAGSSDDETLRVNHMDAYEEPLLLDKSLKRLSSNETNAIINPIVNSRLVVGGIESMPGEFPYIAALHGGPDEVFFCGGMLISLNWLITAAHCVGNRTQPDGWMVKVGVTRRIASPAFVKKLKVKEIIKHPNFNHNSLFNNDIALILLEESVEFNQFLRPICLPQSNLKLGPDNSKDCVVVGFGKSKFSQEANYLHVAHFVNVPIVRHSICSSWYAEHGVNLTDGMLCAGYAEGKRDACQGDSGSGLFCRYSNKNQFFVAGVVSFGIKCATPKLPGVYTSVPLYVDWIETTTRQHGYPLN